MEANTERYDELLEGMKKDLFEHLDAIAYAMSLDSKNGDSLATKNAIITLNQAIKEMY